MTMAFIDVLENDLRALSAEARIKRYPSVKDSAERAILRLRSISDPVSIAKSDEVLQTFLLACESKCVKLSVIALVCLQKLVAHDAVAAGSLSQILFLLKDSSENFDESVQLKTLQTVLTILQSRLQPKEETNMAILLEICFRLLGNVARSSDSVYSTAAATLRQAVALIFDRILQVESLPPTPRGHRASRSNSLSGDISRTVAAQIKSIDTVIANQKRVLRYTLTAQSRMGLRLLEDLVSLASGGQATWLAVSCIPRAFSLEMVDYVLSHYVSLFISLSPYQQMLRQRVCTLLITSLRATGEIDGEVGEPAFRRQLLWAVGTVVRFYSSIITTEVEVFLTMLVKTADMDLTVWYRIYVLELLRAFCVEPRTLRTIFCAFDMRPKNSNVMADMVACLARVASLVQVPDAGEESLLTVAGMFGSKEKRGVEWLLDFDATGTNSQLQASEAHAITLALEGLLGVVFTIATLTDEALDTGELESPRTEDADRKPELSPDGLADTCCKMVESVWVTVLDALSLMLSKSTAKTVISEVLEGYKAFAQACGMLGLVKPRDAFLGSLCTFALTHQHDSFKRTIDGDPKEGAMLTSKNVQALQTLFKIVHRLDNLLGPSWSLVLETLAALDRMLHSPHAATSHEVSLTRSTSRERDAGVISTQSIDFQILSALDAQLFESSSSMSDFTVRSLLRALWQVCKKTLLGVTSGLGMSASGNSRRGSSVGVPAQTFPKMFAVERMVDTMVYNMHRVDRLWGELVPHLLELACHESAQVRMVAIDALERSVMAVLGCEKILNETRKAREREASQEEATTRTGSSRDVTLLGKTSTAGRSDDRARRIDNGDGVARECVDGVVGTSGVGLGGRGKDDALTDELLPGAEITKEKQATGSFECIVILPLCLLYHSGKGVEERAGALRIVLHALKRHGEKLFHSWPDILKLYRDVADSGEKDLVPLGFQGVSVVMNDCLSYLPEELVNSCVEVTGAYGSQHTDVNISLTAIGLLWTTVDFFARGEGARHIARAVTSASVHAKAHGGMRGGASDTNPGRQSGKDPAGGVSKPAVGEPNGLVVGKQPPERQTSRHDPNRELQEQQLVIQLDAYSEDMLFTMFCMIKSLGTDDRPEVRNSAIRTLFSSIVSHGPKLSQSLWRSCLWELLFPLLETVRHLAATSSRDKWVGKELGKQGGKPVHMLVHHSRNTAQKQWDETLVVGLNGMSRLLRSFFSVVHKMEGFESVWESLLQFVEESVLEGSKEVAMAALNSLCSILQAHGVKRTLPRYHWESALDTLDLIARNSAHSDSRVPLEARTELVENFGALFKSCYSLFEPEDYLLLLAMVDVLVRYPTLRRDAPAPVPALMAGILPQVQRTALEVFPLMYPRDERLEHLWPQFLRQLITYLPGGNRVLCEHLRIPTKYMPQSGDGQIGAGSGGGHENQGQHPGGGVCHGSRVASGISWEREDTGLREPSEAGSPRQPSTLSVDTRGFPDTSPGALSHGFAERIAMMLVDLYIDHADPAARALVLPDVIGGIGRCMGVRRDAPSHPLWRTAVGVFDKVLQTALIPDAISASLDNGRPGNKASQPYGNEIRGPTRPRLWKELVDLFERFLVGSCGRAVVGQSTEPISPRTQKADEALELFVLDALCDRVLISCQDAPEDVKARLVSVVDRCAGRTSSLPVESAPLLPLHCQQFSLRCLQKLSVLCRRADLHANLEEDSSIIQVAKVALPVLILRCETIIKRFLEDDKQTGGKGMPQMRVEELVCLLQESARLAVHPLVSSSLDIPICFRKDKKTTLLGSTPAASPPASIAYSDAIDGQLEHVFVGPATFSDRITSPLPDSLPDSSSVSPLSSTNGSQPDAETKEEDPKRNGWERGHLLVLYGPLCELIVCQQRQIRELTRVLFRLAGAELKLLRDSTSS